VRPDRLDAALARRRPARHLGAARSGLNGAGLPFRLKVLDNPRFGLQAGTDNFSLCHGLAGNSEALLHGIGLFYLRLHHPATPSVMILRREAYGDPVEAKAGDARAS
jgi:hypothetical protein